MEDQVNNLVQKLWTKYQATKSTQRLLVGIAGIPGSGKTTLAALITARLNALSALSAFSALQTPAICIPMDGYHLTRAQLSAMPDPTTANARRGAAFTFDADAFVNLVRALRAPIGEGVVYAPSFDHAVKDPVADDLAVHPKHRIVVLEGLYLALDEEPWRAVEGMLDELVFVKVDFDVARARLAARHVRAGIVQTEEEGRRRADESDLVNGRQILDHRVKGITETVVSREDGGWKDGGAVEEVKEEVVR
ncbi:phosphoribulokinase/uridine kinase [Microthyrium microscopicum]|uniref:Phosphoribulokinase/uridine kinase n=1 Tax=Microthyrium microscopicum TaxID=703497 RepID=A0A6A6UMQ2_9PEZI|nr:phosphoribulokinase/uridine kinase [Microthyrium microscopicum]